MDRKKIQKTAAGEIPFVMKIRILPLKRGYSYFLTKSVLHLSNGIFRLWSFLI